MFKNKNSRERNNTHDAYIIKHVITPQNCTLSFVSYKRFQFLFMWSFIIDSTLTMYPSKYYFRQKSHKII